MRIKADFEALRRIQERRAPVTIRTTLGEYLDMVLAELRFDGTAVFKPLKVL